MLLFTVVRIVLWSTECSVIKVGHGKMFTSLNGLHSKETATSLRVPSDQAFPLIASHTSTQTRTHAFFSNSLGEPQGSVLSPFAWFPVPPCSFSLTLQHIFQLNPADVL